MRGRNRGKGVGELGCVLDGCEWDLVACDENGGVIFWVFYHLGGKLGVFGLLELWEYTNYLVGFRNNEYQ
jgi:hypothetical protein